MKKDNRQRRPVVNLEPCYCAVAVMYIVHSRPVLIRKTRHCLTLHPLMLTGVWCFVANPVVGIFLKNQNIIQL